MYNMYKTYLVFKLCPRTSQNVFSVSKLYSMISNRSGYVQNIAGISSLSNTSLFVQKCVQCVQGMSDMPKILMPKVFKMYL